MVRPCARDGLDRDDTFLLEKFRFVTEDEASCSAVERLETSDGKVLVIDRLIMMYYIFDLFDDG